MEQGREIQHSRRITPECYFIKMKHINPIPKEIREEMKELRAMRLALIKKGVITDAEIKSEKDKNN